MNSTNTYDTVEEAAAIRALTASIRTGIWTALTHGCRPAVKLAEELDLVPDAVRRILQLLEARGWTRQTARGWTVNPKLVENGGMLPESVPHYVERLEGLEDYLKNGEPTQRFGGGKDYARVASDLGSMFAACADELARRLPFQPTSVLDLGAGSGVFGLAMARRHKLDRLVGFDRAEVIPAFERHAVESGFETIATGRAGDFLFDELPSDFDCALLCNVLRILSRDDAQSLLDRARDTLRPGGHLVVVDVIGEDPPGLRLRRSMYRLDLALRNDSGSTFSQEELRLMYESSNLELKRDFRLEHGPLGELVHILMPGPEEK